MEFRDSDDEDGAESGSSTHRHRQAKHTKAKSVDRTAAPKANNMHGSQSSGRHGVSSASHNNVKQSNRSQRMSHSFDQNSGYRT